MSSSSTPFNLELVLNTNSNVCFVCTEKIPTNVYKFELSYEK